MMVCDTSELVVLFVKFERVGHHLGRRGNRRSNFNESLASGRAQETTLNGSLSSSFTLVATMLARHARRSQTALTTQRRRTQPCLQDAKTIRQTTSYKCAQLARRSESKWLEPKWLRIYLYTCAVHILEIYRNQKMRRSKSNCDSTHSTLRIHVNGHLNNRGEC